MAQAPQQHAFDADSEADELPANLEIATDTSSNPDNDSGLGFSFEDSTTSLRSSVYHYIAENGRTYHAYNSGKYMLPNDEAEQERLDLQHHSFKIMLNGRLHLAPLPQYPRRVLDLGTGTGIWAIEFAQEHTETRVVGTDLSPIQPDLLPANCHFEIGDAEEEDWGFDEPFDYIHGRALFACSWKVGKPIVQRIFDNLEPGGYFELQDPCMPMRCDDGSLDGTALAEWNRLLVEGMLRIGKDITDNLNWGRYMREVGFVDVVETHATCAFNTWPKGERNKLLGAISCQNLLEGVQSMSMALFTRVLGWTPERLAEFLVDVRSDLKNKRIHSYCNVYFVHGRKPLQPAR